MIRLFLVLSFIIAFATSVFADTPVGPMNYQGRLLNNAGIPVAGNHNFVVRVYDAVSNGTLKYQENHNAIAVDDGVYALLVGTQTKTGGDSTWSVELWNCCANLFMEIVVNGEALTPRHRLAAAPYAFQANLALTTNNALALGGKSATEYNNILASICTSSKGKWLEIVGKCLGVGASFPGPTVVALNTLTASTDLSGLDLTKADISGINFGAANFTGTLFKGTTLKPTGINGANLTNAVLDGVITSGSATFTANFSGATIKNMSLAGWSMNGANFAGLSAAYLTACPTTRPTNWVCRLQRPGGQYFLVGPSANLSSTSALAVEKADGRHLDLDKSTALWATGLYLENVKMTGVIVTQNIYFTSIFNIDFSNSRFMGVYFYGLGVPQYGTSGLNFTNSTWENSQIWMRADEPSDGLNFTNARFSYSKLQLPIINLTPQYEFLGFGGAVFENTTIMGGGGPVLPMNDVTFNNVVLDVDAASLELINAKIFGGFAVTNPHANTLMETSYITQARLTGNFDSWNFNENIVYHSQLDGNFSDSSWSSNELNNSIMGYTMYNAAVANQGNYVIGYVRWYGVCPDDDMASTEGNADNNYYCDVSW